MAKEFFINRAALKMAAMDASFDGLFSCADAGRAAGDAAANDAGAGAGESAAVESPAPPSDSATIRSEHFASLTSWHELAAAAAEAAAHGVEGPPPPGPRPVSGVLYFGDVAAGPGGFSEYVLWRRGGSAKGLGFTLRGSHDFTVHRFHHAAPPEVKFLSLTPLSF